MTTAMKTQCPQCQTAFEVPKAALNNTQAKARCGRCQHAFLVNDFLIVSAKSADRSKHYDKKLDDEKAHDKKLASKTSNPKPKDINDNDDGDLLIHDDMEIDAATEDVTDYSSVDDMDAWLDQLEATSIVTPPQAKPQSQSEPSQQSAASHTSTKPILPSAATLPQDLASSFSDNKSRHHNNDHAQNPKNQALPSAPFNGESFESADPNAKSDNDWLESLLAAQNSETLPSLAKTEDPELAEMLTHLGMMGDDEARLEKERQDKIAARLKLSSAPPAQSMATFLWSLGCLVLVLLLAAQYVIFNLDTLIKKPAYAAKLQSLCAIAACSLPNADIDNIAMSAVTIRPSQVKASDSFSDIQASLINQGETLQLLPNMKVSLYSNDTLAGEFIALPEDYILAHESQIGANHQKPIMFTVPIAAKKLQKVTIEPFY